DDRRVTRVREVVHRPRPDFSRPHAGVQRHRVNTGTPAASVDALEEKIMTFSLSIGPIVALIAGILILVLPRLLNYIIALYLIIVGVIGLFAVPALRADVGDVPPASWHNYESPSRGSVEI